MQITMARMSSCLMSVFLYIDKLEIKHNITLHNIVKEGANGILVPGGFSEGDSRVLYFVGGMGRRIRELKVCDIVKKQVALPARKFECTRESKCTTLGVDSLNRVPKAWTFHASLTVIYGTSLRVYTTKDKLLSLRWF
ncbi:hypothetical protein P8452_46791 [Trifolium repens]|nr:hypothetical protein P8452_46791 [Trifolium repens]